METPVVKPMVVVGEEEDNKKEETLSSVLNEGGENSVHLIPPQNITSNLSLSSLAAAAASTNASLLGDINSEATRFSTEIKKLSVQLVLAQRRIKKQEAEIDTQNAKLVEASGLIEDQQRQLDEVARFSFGQEIEDAGGRDEANLEDLKELKNLVALERKQRLDAEEKFAKLRNSVTQMQEEYSQFFEEVKEHLIEEGQLSTSSSKERLDQLSKFVEQRFEKWMKEQMTLKATVKGMNQVVRNLMEIINSQNFTESTAPPERNANLNQNATSKTKPVSKVTASKSVKVIRTEVGKTTIKVPPKKIVQKYEEVAGKEHAEDTSKSHTGFFCICGVDYSSKGNLVIHIRQLTEEGKFECQICHEKFVLFYMLRRHLESKHNIKPKKGNGAHCVGCMDCGKTFASQSHLWKHRKSAHSQISAGNQNASTSKPKTEPNDPNEGPPVAKTSTSPALRFVTPKITKVTPNETVSISGKKHGMNIAKRHQGFFCICGIKFISRKSLDGHVRFQNKDTDSSRLPVSKTNLEHKVVPNRPLECICGFRSANKHFTTKHVMYHTTERKFSCDLCPKLFLNMAYLREHYLKSHKLSKDIALGNGCRKCGLSFETMKEFHVHSRIVHGFGSARKKSVKQEVGAPEVSTPSHSPPSLSTSSKTAFRTTGLAINRSRRELQVKDTHGSLNEQDEDDDEYFGSPPISPQPLPIYFDDDEIPFGVKLEPTAAASPRPVKQEVDDEDMGEDHVPSDILVEVHQHDTTRKSKFFYCTCGPRFASKKILRTHIKQKTEKWNFQCEICNKLFFYNSTLKAHMLKSHPNVKAENTFADLRKHEKVEINEKSTAVPSVPDEEVMQKLHTFPPVGTKSPKLANNAKQSHGHDTEKQHLGLFYCICGKNCLNELRLKGHIRYNNKDFRFSCDICGSRFAFQSFLQRHLDHSHKIEGDSKRNFKFPCNFCEKGFPFKSYLTRHLERVHKIEGGDDVEGGSVKGGDMEVASSTSRVKRQSQCTKCGKSFNTQMELLQHNKLFHKMTSLRKGAKSRIRKKKVINRHSVHHQISSSSSDVYACVCGSSYALKGSLSKHIVKKSRGKIFKCDQCPKSFLDVSYLRVHSKSKHNIDLEDKRHGCGICGKLFRSVKECKRHRLRVHGTQRNF